MKGYALLALAALLAAACAGAGDKKKEEAPAPKSERVERPIPAGKRRAAVAQFDNLFKHHKIGFGLAAESFGISESDDATVNYAIIRTRVEPHKHLDHDEVFIVVVGEGMLYVESADGGVQSHEVRDGTIFHIPRGVAHAYEHLSGSLEETLGINIFTPCYSKPDAVAVSWPLGKGPTVGKGGEALNEKGAAPPGKKGS